MSNLMMNGLTVAPPNPSPAASPQMAAVPPYLSWERMLARTRSPTASMQPAYFSSARALEKGKAKVHLTLARNSPNNRYNSTCF